MPLAFSPVPQVLTLPPTELRLAGNKALYSSIQKETSFPAFFLKLKPLLAFLSKMLFKLVDSGTSASNDCCLLGFGKISVLSLFNQRVGRTIKDC